MWLSILSIFLTDRIKSERWLLWDRRMSWVACHDVYHDFSTAYYCLRLHEQTRLMLMECYKVTK